MALWGITITGGGLTIALPSSQAENAIQVGTYGALAGIVVRSLQKADTVISAALRLADELAARREAGDEVPDGNLAPVVAFPPQRSERHEVS